MTIWRPIQRSPPASLNLRQQSIALRVHRIDNVEIAVRAVAPGRIVYELAAVPRPLAHVVLRLPVSQHRDVAGCEIVAIYLGKLAAAYVLTVQEILAAIRMETRGADRVFEERELVAR